MNHDDSKLDLENKPTPATSAAAKSAEDSGDRKRSVERKSAPASDAEKSTEAAKPSGPAGNTAKLGCSRAARDQIETLVKKLVAVGTRIDAAVLVNEIVDAFGQAGGYIVFARRSGTLVSAKVVVEERIEGQIVTSELPLAVTKRQAKNPFSVALKPAGEVKG